MLYVHDIERSTAFYRDVLGFPQILGRPGGRFAGFSSGRTHRELLLIEVGHDAREIPSGRRVGMYHIGLKVGDSDGELREAHDRLEAHGTSIVGASDHTVTHSLYLLDLDGNELELYIDVPGVDWRAHPDCWAPPSNLCSSEPLQV